MIRRVAVTIAILIIGYLVFFIWNAPASWLVAEAGPQLRSAQATLSDARGGAWNGSAELVFRGTDLGRLHWHSSPWHLFTGHVAADFGLSGQGLTLQGRVDAGGKLTRLTDIRGEAALPLLASFFGLPGGLDGTLTAHLDKVLFARDGLLQAATGRLEAQGASLPQLGVSLGTLTLTLDTAQNEIHGQLANTSGDLDLDGVLTLTPAGAYTLQASLLPHPGQNQLADGLAAFLGAPDASGRYHYNTSGRLQP